MLSVFRRIQMRKTATVYNVDAYFRAPYKKLMGLRGRGLRGGSVVQGAPGQS